VCDIHARVDDWRRRFHPVAPDRTATYEALGWRRILSQEMMGYYNLLYVLSQPIRYPTGFEVRVEDVWVLDRPERWTFQLVHPITRPGHWAIRPSGYPLGE
jgi:hypothetical protein